MDATPPEGAQPSQPILTAQVVREVPSPQAPRRRSGWKRFLTTLFVLAFLGSLMFNLMLLAVVAVTALGSEHRLQEKYVSHNRHAADKVAVISVEGVISDSDDSLGFVKRQIDWVIEDKNVKAVVLRVDSPGGTVSASDYIYHHLCEMPTVGKRKIPLVVSMGGMAASGGYYISMAVGHEPKTIFAEPTTWTGSIGVLIPHFDLAGLMDKVGAKEDSVVSGPLKEMGSFTRPMTPAERKVFQALVDDSFGRFKEIVCSGRAASRPTMPPWTSWPPGRSSPPSRPRKPDWSMRSVSSKRPSTGRSNWPSSTRKRSKSSATCPSPASPVSSSAVKARAA